MKKSGQLDLSFGLIFSVILIVVFLGFAIYAIIGFLGMKEKIEIGKFLNDLQSNVNTYWKANQGTDQFSYFLPVGIKEVCFLNKETSGIGPKENIYDELEKYLSEGDNLIFYPIGSAKSVKSAKIEHIDLAEMTKQENPLCFENKNGKTTLSLEQEYGGTQLVNIRR
ncbi:MAG: hypothetical protein ABIH28_01095 [archaeon]